MRSRRHIIRLALLSTTLLAMVACSIPRLSMPRFPRVYKITVQQGNVLSQAMVDKLKPGMTRSQVAFIMGEPVIRNSFNENRWDYIYRVEVPGYFETSQRVTLFFQDELLAYFTGDMAPTSYTGQTDQQPPTDTRGIL